LELSATLYAFVDAVDREKENPLLRPRLRTAEKLTLTAFDVQAT
jgi:hypothetical protein